MTTCESGLPVAGNDDCDDDPLPLRDQDDLRLFFGLAWPAPPGERSHFGPMCDRIANRLNPNTLEVPSRGTPWTELVKCKKGGGDAPTGEDGFISYIDVRKRLRGIDIVLEKLPSQFVDVLAAHYGAEVRKTWPFDYLANVAPFTWTARAKNRARARKSNHEAVQETVSIMIATAKDTRRPKAERMLARQFLKSVRSEASNLLGSARKAYLIARGKKPCR